MSIPATAAAAAAATGPRVISLLPSATEIVTLVGGARFMVGRSHECDFPKSITHLPMLTDQKTTFTTPADVDTQVREALSSGTSLYTIDKEQITRLKPTVIVTQSLCSVCSIDYNAVAAFANQLAEKPKIVSLNPHTLEEMLESVLNVGTELGLEVEAKEAVAQLQKRIDQVVSNTRDDTERPRVAFIEWTEPIYVGGHWTPQLIKMAGGSHPLNEIPGSKSFSVSPEEVVASNPDVVLVAPCGLGLEETEKYVQEMYRDHEWFRHLEAVKQGKVFLVDGNQMFNRPGPRLVDSLEFLSWLLNNLSTADRVVPDHLQDYPFKHFVPNVPKPGDGIVVPRDVVVQGAKPTFTPEIEEAHRNAMAKEANTYIDPATGYTVFTELAALKRGYCCGKGCRHCPYGHVNVKKK